MIYLIILLACICIMIIAERIWKNEAAIYSALFAGVVFAVGIFVGMFIQ